MAKKPAWKRPITVSMHRVLKRAHNDVMGEVRGDRGVVGALVRRGLARVDEGLIVITVAGRWAVELAPLDPRSQPSGLNAEQFRFYLENRSAPHAY